MMISGSQIVNYIYYYIDTVRCYEKESRLELSDKKSEPIHVIANGPTFNDSYKYVNEMPGKTMMCNFALNDFDFLVPDYYVLADPIYLCMDQEYRGQYYDYFKENGSMDRISQLREKLHMLDKKMEIFCPSFLDIEHVICNSNLLWNHVNTKVYLPMGIDGALKRWKKNKAAPRVQSVVVLELFVALQLGYKTIYLHGCEESGIFGGSLTIDQDDNTLLLADSHFYEKASKRKRNDLNMLIELRAQEILFSSLYELEDYSKALGARIINMSKNSWIDCFERFIEKD